MVVHACCPSYSGGRGRRIVFRGQPWEKLEMLSKNKRAWGMTQVVEHLPSKHEVLSSNTNTTTKKRMTNK
jgi:hypothetical protein